MKDDSGPAFPVGSGDMSDPMGMTLRDYFAGQALAGLAAICGTDTAAKSAYDYADAMLRERDKADV